MEAQESGAPAALTAGVQTVRVEDLQPNPHQPRTTFDPTTLQELAASIRAHGIIQPLVVTIRPQPHRRLLDRGR